MAANARPPIVPPSPDGVPLEMRALRRWAPWRAEWNEKKQKYTKVPHRASNPQYGLSNKGPAGWVTFEDAMAVYAAHNVVTNLRDRDGKPIVFSGVGYLMTGPHGITGVDLDNCRDPVTGKVDDWALEVAAKLDSYTEVSPSGTGLHAMVLGGVPTDWTNHEQGIEVYGGNEARFLCVTGQRLPGTNPELQPPRAHAMESLAAQYRKAPTLAQVEDLHLPVLLPVDLLPGLDELDLPPHASNFLTDGPGPGDRSRQLFATAIALSTAGLQPDEVLSILEDNQHAMEVALDHRRQDYDKALRYLWKQCQQGEARGVQLKEDGYAAFDMLDEPGDVETVPAQAGMPAGDASDDFDVLDDDEQHQQAAPAKPARKTKFPLLSAGAFLQRKPMQWMVRGLLPRAALAVVYGQSTAGKTFFALDLALAITRGVEWRGKRVSKGRGVYIVAEGTEGFRNRVQAYCEYHGLEAASLDIVVLPAAPQMMDKAQVKELILDLQTLGRLDFIVIDTYARVMVGGNENDAADTGVMVDHCARLHRHTGALVIVIHHAGKDVNSGARGSSVLKAAADVEIEVIRTKEYRAARVAKMKDGDDSGEFRFQLPIVELGENEDGDPITSCVVSHLETPGGDGASTAGLKGLPAEVFAWATDAIDLVDGLTYADLIEACVSQMPAPTEPGKRDRRRDSVVRAIDGLLASNKLRIADNYVQIG